MEAIEDSKNKKILIIVHQETSTPGRIGMMLRAMGFALDIRRPCLGDPLPETMDQHAGAVVFGGPMSANDPEPWIARDSVVVAQGPVPCDRPRADNGRGQSWLQVRSDLALIARQGEFAHSRTEPLKRRAAPSTATAPIRPSPRRSAECSNRSAASITFGSKSTSLAVFRNTCSFPSTQCTARSIDS